MTWRVTAASVTGARHVATGDGCDDAHVFAVVGDALVVAVADGAGSARRAADGSALAATTAVTALVAELTGAGPPIGRDDARHSVCASMVAARGALERAARREQIDLGDLATTLLVALAGPERLVVAGIGDGAVVGRFGDGLTCLAPVVRGEYVNETVFVTSDGWWDGLRLEEAAPPDGLALCTDGVELLAIETATGQPHLPFFDPLFAYAAGPEASSGELAAFLASDRVRTRTDDDCTLVLAVA